MSTTAVPTASSLKERRAATVIGRTCEKHLSLRTHFISMPLFREAREFMESTNVTKLPRAPFGRTPVYFPSNLPIVFKHSGAKESKVRLQKMIQARQLCEKNGFTSLVIPTARVQGCFIIESRLPLPLQDQKNQIGLYSENRDQFTQAARELTAFLCQSYVGDLSGNCKDPWSSVCQTVPPRYDNAALYLDASGEGKIGLVDLEDFVPAPKSKSAFDACLQAIRLFPYHFEEILAVAKEFDGQIESKLGELREEERQMLDYVQLVYRNHRLLCEEQGIVLEKSPQLLELSSQDKERLADWLLERLETERNNLGRIKLATEMQFLLYMNTIEPERRALFLPPGWADSERRLPVSEGVLSSLKDERLPELCEEVIDLVNELLESNHQKMNPGSYSELLSARSCLFDQTAPIYSKLKAAFYAKFETFPFENTAQMNYLNAIMIESFFTGLQAIGKAAYYNPRFGFHSYPYHCLFC